MCFINVFIVKNKKLYTPPLSDGCVDGIMRKHILKICKKEKISAKEKSIDADVYNKALLIKNYSVHIRYPNPFEDPSEADVLEAVACAEFFRNFVVGVLGI